MNLPPTLRKFAEHGLTFSRALLKDDNLLSRPQPEAVLAPVSYRSSRRRRQRKRLLLKVPIDPNFSLELVIVSKQLWGPKPRYTPIVNLIFISMVVCCCN